MQTPNDTLTIGLTGDVMIGRLTNEALSYRKPASLWGDLLPLMQETDFTLINLEAALTTSEKAVPKVFNFKADPEKIQALIEGSVSVANLANNHVLDYDVEGLLETLETLDHAHIQHVGAGKNATEARKPVILSKNGIKIGILGYTDNEPPWIATKQSPGTRYIKVGDIETIQNDVKQVRDQVDIVIVTIHWGPNMRERPTPDFVEFAHQMIDNGVDIIHGHSAHIFQGVEVYQGGLILYDTGECVDDYYVDRILRNDRSFFFIVEVNKKGFQQLRLVPIFISNCQVNLAQGSDKAETLKRMQMLSAELGTNLPLNDGELFYWV